MENQHQCSPEKCSVLKFFCSCDKSKIMCLLHMSKHQTAICQGSKFEICRFWSPEKNEIINIRFGSTFLEAYEFIKEEYKIEGNLFGCCRGVSPSLEKFTCEAKEKITFGLYEEARLSTKIIVNYKKTQIWPRAHTVQNFHFQKITETFKIKTCF